VGEWEVVATGTDSLLATTTIEPLLNGLVIQESFTARNGFAGTSLTSFKKAAQTWEQYWVDNAGQILLLTGGLTPDGSMVLSGEAQAARGPYLNRVTWTHGPGWVRQVHAISTNQGQDWKTVFDGTYRPKK
jgi:hypothetical protein